MDRIGVVAVEPLREAVGRVRVPPSKSYTHRAILSSVLADGAVEVLNPLISGDTRASIRLARKLGSRVSVGSGGVRILSRGPRWGGSCNCGESGTTLRIGVGLSSLLDRPMLFYGVGRLNERPIRPLLDALSRLGASYLDSAGYPPVAVRGPIGSGYTQVDAGQSSQFLSSLLIAGAGVDGGIEVEVLALSSSRYVDITVEVLAMLGVTVEREGYKWFRVRGPPRPGVIRVPGDWSSAAPHMVLVAAVGGGIVLEDLRYPDPQPDSRIVEVLRGLGVKVVPGSGGVAVEASGRVEGFEVDVDESPDLAPVLASLGAVACGYTRICGASRLRLKESDRVEAILSMLSRAGVEAGYGGGCIVIRGSCGRLEGGFTLDSWGDHRIAMASAILAAASRRGGAIRGWRAVDKSYPGFWEDLGRLGVVTRVAG